jgi:dihydropteroate synthase
MTMREWKLPQHTLPLGERTLLMGVVNLTPDSFSEGSGQFTRARAHEQTELMLADGADIIDIGGESTRPGAHAVAEAEELRRIEAYLPIIGQLKASIPFSVDTTKGSVARFALAAGVEIINDISGLRFDPSIADAAASFEAGLILMHSRGTFETMHKLAAVPDIMSEVAAGWRQSINEALGRGVRPEKIVLDPGIGFGKSQQQNLELIARLDELALEFRDFPLLVGTSRKSFIGRLLNGAPVNERLQGTMATVAAAVLGGAQIVRVHDVRASVETVRVIDAIKRAGASARIASSAQVENGNHP